MSTEIDYTIMCPYYEANCDMTTCSCPKYKAYEAVQKPEAVENKLTELGFDLNSGTWPLIMAIQLSFAKRLHKMENLTKDEVDHWVDKYLICIEDEVREVREHLRIYPEQLKDILNDTVKSNKKELQKEVIDILHFVMDLFLCGNANAEDIEKAYLKKYAPNVIDVKDLLAFAWDNQYEKTKREYEPRDIDDIILLLVNKLLDANGGVRQQISWKHWKKPSNTIDYDKLYEAYADVFKILMDLFIFTMDNIDDVKNIYLTKNVENIYRQQFGY
ncbi:MAG: hypothetical protein ACOCP8_01795 [archaeon]